jgi:hypothetical protein
LRKLLERRGQIMSTSYATEKVTAAIRNHLITVDAVPPTMEATRLASEITEIVWSELRNAGLSRGALENLFASASGKTKAQGRA